MTAYLDSITLTKTLPCLAEPDRIIVIGKPSRSLGEVLPYLATLPGIIAWNPEARTLTFRRPHGFMTLYEDKVYITTLADRRPRKLTSQSSRRSLPCGAEVRRLSVRAKANVTSPTPAPAGAF